MIDRIFQTRRLLVRRLRRSDLSSFHALQSDPLVMKYSAGLPMTEDQNREDLILLIRSYEQPENKLRVWALERKKDDEFLGTCALVRETELRYEIGVRIIRSYWGLGYGKEITRDLICHAFYALGAEECVASIWKENAGAVQMAQHFMNFKKEFYDEKEQMMDQSYQISCQLFLAECHSSNWNAVGEFE